MIKLCRSYFFVNEDWFKNMNIPEKSIWTDMILKEESIKFWSEKYAVVQKDIETAAKKTQAIKSLANSITWICKAIEDAQKDFQLITQEYAERESNKNINNIFKNCFESMFNIGNGSFNIAIERKESDNIKKGKVTLYICQFHLLLDEFCKLNCISEQYTLRPAKYDKKIHKLIIELGDEIVQLHNNIVKLSNELPEYKACQDVLKQIKPIYSLIAGEVELLKRIKKDTKKGKDLKDLKQQYEEIFKKYVQEGDNRVISPLKIEHII